MKKLIFLSLMVGFAFMTESYRVKTIKTSYFDTSVSKALGDSITIPQGAFEIQPIIADVNGDSARSFSWYAFGVSPDSTQGCQTYCQLYDKSGRSIAQFNCPIDAATKNRWGLADSVITNFIVRKNPRIVLVN